MLDVAVIGVGNMGRAHARIYYQLNNVNLVAISDLNETIGREVADKFSTKFYKDYREMLSKEKIDAISIVVPTKYHKQVSLFCIKEGKHILVEKPIAENIEDAQEIINTAEKKEIKLAVGHIERFNPAVIELKKQIDKGVFGDIISLVTRRVGGFPPQIKDSNVVIDLAVHDIDVYNYLLGTLPTKVAANTRRALISQREDSAELFLTYSNTTGYIQVNWITPVKIRNLSITGTKGYAELDYISQDLTLFKSNFVAKTVDFEEFVEAFGSPEKNLIHIKKEEPLKKELENFIGCILTDKYPEVGGKEAIAALKICMEALDAGKKQGVL